MLNFVVCNYLIVTQPRGQFRVFQIFSFIIFPNIINNKWYLFNGLAVFCLNTFSINHLGNYSAYSILFGREPPDLSEIKVEKSRLTKISHYHFGDYLDMLNERMSCIRNIVKEHHNETIRKHQLEHGSTSEHLRSFNEGDIVYCHFPSNTIISQMKIASRK